MEVKIPSWDELFMRQVYLIASKSKDPRTKIGAVLVNNGTVISMGYNGFARGVKDLTSRYEDRETKYALVVHGEANAVLNAVRNGIKTMGSILYTQGLPCCECGKTVIQAGITEVVIHTKWPTFTSPNWVKSVSITKSMFEEAGIKVREFDEFLNVDGHVDGKIIKV